MLKSKLNKYLEKGVKPVSNHSRVDQSLALAAVTGSYATNDANEELIVLPVEKVSYSSSTVDQVDDLWDFCRLYKVMNIPILDFFVIYIILYVLNKLYFGLNYKFILVLSVLVTVMFESLTSDTVQINLAIMSVIIICIILLLIIKPK
jgi:hypothetical protein